MKKEYLETTKVFDHLRTGDIAGKHDIFIFPAKIYRQNSTEKVLNLVGHQKRFKSHRFHQ